MNLIPEASKWYKMFSVQALVFIMAVQAVLALIPPERAAAVVFGDWTWTKIGDALSFIVAALGAIGRVLDQGITAKPPLTEADALADLQGRPRPDWKP